ncbi:MAG TPA: CoA ester lyase [Anaerolineae bacterium]|nr:CoA ester lyase [Anaerolineae bacterium]
MKLLRSMLFTPGNNMRMIHKAGTLGADAVILDLEDAVPMAEKETARIFVRDSIQRVGAEGAEVFVRVNALPTGLTAEDLRWAVQLGLTGVVLPKTESREDVHEVERLITELEEEKGMEPGGLALMPLLETARGVLNAREIATASQRIVALGFGALDFTRDMGINLSQEGTELFYARSHIALVARAAGVQAIDAPWTDIADREGLVQGAKMARQLGFRGKMLIHPSQIEPVNRVFSPSESEVAYARRMVEAFREAEAQGLGVISLDGRMVDIANVRQAEELIARAEAIAQKKSRKE